MNAFRPAVNLNETSNVQSTKSTDTTSPVASVTTNDSSRLSWMGVLALYPASVYW